MRHIGRRAFLKRLIGAGAFGGVLFGSSEVAYLVRQATWQRAQRTRLVLLGSVVTFQPDVPVIEQGAIYLDEQGRIAAVRPSRDPALPGYGTCNGYLGHPFVKKALWAVIASLFLSVRWNSAIDAGGESFSFTRENTGVWTANHQGRLA